MYFGEQKFNTILLIKTAIIADIFMCAIEKITSKTTVIKYPDPNDPNNFIDREVKMYAFQRIFFQN